MFKAEQKQWLTSLVLECRKSPKENRLILLFMPVRMMEEQELILLFCDTSKEEKMKVGMMGAFKRGGKQDEDKPAKDRKKDDRDRKNKPSKDQTDSRRSPQIGVPKVQVIAPGAARGTPPVISERKVLPVGTSQFAGVAERLIEHRHLRRDLGAGAPAAQASAPARRASLPLRTAAPFLSPHDTRGAHERPDGARLRRKSTALPYRRRSFNVVQEDQYVTDPLECLLPQYSHPERLNVPPANLALKFSMYVDSIFIGTLVGVTLAVVLKGILMVVERWYKP